MSDETKATHTPGPWVIEQAGENDPQPCGVRSLAVKAGSIAHIYKKDTDEEKAANAHLIASAPSMLAALEDIVQMILFQTLISNDSPTLKRARAAIANAKGDSKPCSTKNTDLETGPKS